MNQTTKFRIIDVMEKAFVAVNHDGWCQTFLLEEVHPDERPLIRVGADFDVRETYLVGVSHKTHAWRVEFGATSGY